MHLTAPSHWSRSIVAGGRDAPEQLVTIVVVRTMGTAAGKPVMPAAAAPRGHTGNPRRQRRLHSSRATLTRSGALSRRPAPNQKHHQGCRRANAEDDR